MLVQSLEPGKVTVVAPPPFAPFERGELPPVGLRALVRDARAQQGLAPVPLRQAPPASDADTHAPPGSGRRCPMCRQVHPAKAKLELAA